MLKQIELDLDFLEINAEKLSPNINIIKTLSPYMSLDFVESFIRNKRRNDFIKKLACKLFLKKDS